MLKRSTIIPAALAVTIGLGACSNSSADSATSIPATATSRADIEAIVHAYIVEHPEVILEAMETLTAREQADMAKSLASDDRDFSIGPKDAPVTIVEFFDYRCGYCKMSLDWVIQKANDSDGKIRVVFKELPILSDQSRTAAEAALAAKEQGKYLELHQALMKYPSELSDANIQKIAKGVGLNVTRMEKDMERPEIAAHITDVREAAQKYGANATPSFFINGELIQGFDKKSLETRIATLLE